MMQKGQWTTITPEMHDAANTISDECLAAIDKDLQIEASALLMSIAAAMLAAKMLIRVSQVDDSQKSALLSRRHFSKITAKSFQAIHDPIAEQIRALIASN